MLASFCAKHILVWVLTGTCAHQAAIDLTQANPNLYVEVPALQDIHGIRLEFSLMKVRPARLAATLVQAAHAARRRAVLCAAVRHVRRETESPGAAGRPQVLHGPPGAVLAAGPAQDWHEARAAAQGAARDTQGLHQAHHRGLPGAPAIAKPHGHLQTLRADACAPAQHCAARGHVCEACRHDRTATIIFPFQTGATQQCQACTSYFHSECYRKMQAHGTQCPKCERIASVRSKRRSAS